MEERQEFKTEFNDGEVEEAKAGIFDTAKEVNYPRLGKLYIKFPTVREDTEVSRFYAETHTRLLMEKKLKPIKILLEMLEEAGIWGEKEESAMKQAYDLYLSKSVTIEELKLKKRKSDEDKANLAQLEAERAEHYDTYIDLQLQKNMQLEHSVEKQSEQEAIIYKMMKCVYKEDGTRRWNSIEEFQTEDTALEIDKLMTDAVLFWRGMSAPLSDLWPAR